MKKTKEQEPTQKSASVRSKTAVRGKYFTQLQRGTNLVILDPALMPFFPDSDSVNRALHAFLAIGDKVKDAAPVRRRSTQGSSFKPRPEKREAAAA